MSMSMIEKNSLEIIVSGSVPNSILQIFAVLTFVKSDYKSFFEVPSVEHCTGVLI